MPILPNLSNCSPAFLIFDKIGIGKNLQKMRLPYETFPKLSEYFLLNKTKF